MGTLNNVPPIEETRHEMIPAQPGWFVFEWQGEEPYTILKAPIVAWLVTTEFYPQTKLQDSRLVNTKHQDSFSTAQLITPGGFEYSDADPVVIAPNGTVYQLNSGQYWPDVPSYVKYDIDRMDAQEKADARRAAARSAVT